MVTPITSKTFFILVAALVAIASYYQVSVFADLAKFSYLGDAAWKAFTIFALAVIFLVLKFVFKANKLLLIAAFALVVTLAPLTEIAWNNLLKDYQRERIVTHFNPESVENVSLTSGFQVRQSIIAIGSGQFNGTGFLKGTQSTLQKLPFAHTDFIFAALAEQFGLRGVIVIFGLYALLTWRVLTVFLNTRDRFGKLLVIGCLGTIVINIFINTAMNLGLIPVTGVPLPLLSYGGSSVLLILITLGLIQSVKISTRTTDFAEKVQWKFLATPGESEPEDN